MSNIDKRALREVAEKATPGPWLWINTGSFFSFLVSESNQDPHQCIIDDGSSWGEYGEVINPESPDGVFIAASNPATVLALLDELEAKDKRIAELQNDEVRQRLANAEHQLHMAELAKHNLRASRKAQFRKRKAAEKRIAELTEIIRLGRKFISEYAGLGDVGAAEFIKIIDRSAAGKGE